MVDFFLLVWGKLQERLSEKGQGMIEYALVLAFVAVVSAAVFMSSDGGGRNYLTNTVSGTYDKTGNVVDNIRVPQGERNENQ